MSGASDRLQSAFFSKFPGERRLRGGLFAVVDQLPDTLVALGVEPTSHPREGVSWWHVGSVAALTSLTSDRRVKQTMYIEGRPRCTGEGLLGLLAVETTPIDQHDRPKEDPQLIRVSHARPPDEGSATHGMIAAWSNAYPVHRFDTHVLIGEVAHFAAENAVADAVLALVDRTPIPD